MSSSEADPAFDIDSQLGQNISNVGGNQNNYYGDGRRGGRIGKVMAALGLVLSLAGLALLVAVAVTTTHSVLDANSSVGGVQTPYTQYLAPGWPIAVGLLVGGFVVNRLARIITGR